MGKTMRKSYRGEAMREGMIAGVRVEVEHEEHCVGMKGTVRNMRL